MSTSSSAIAAAAVLAGVDVDQGEDLELASSSRLSGRARPSSAIAAAAVLAGVDVDQGEDLELADQLAAAAITRATTELASPSRRGHCPTDVPTSRRLDVSAPQVLAATTRARRRAPRRAACHPPAELDPLDRH